MFKLLRIYTWQCVPQLDCVTGKRDLIDQSLYNAFTHSFAEGHRVPVVYCCDTYVPCTAPRMFMGCMPKSVVVAF